MKARYRPDLFLYSYPYEISSRCLGCDYYSEGFDLFRLLFASSASFENTASTVFISCQIPATADSTSA